MISCSGIVVASLAYTQVRVPLPLGALKQTPGKAQTHKTWAKVSSALVRDQ